MDSYLSTTQTMAVFVSASFYFGENTELFVLASFDFSKNPEVNVLPTVLESKFNKLNSFNTNSTKNLQVKLF